AGRHDDDAARSAAVAAREDRGPPALETEPPREEFDEGSLAGASEGQVADRDRRPRQSMRNDASGGVPPRPQLQRFAVQPGKGGERHDADPCPSASAGARPASASAVAAAAPRFAATKRAAPAPRRAVSSGRASDSAKRRPSAAEFAARSRMPRVSP